MGTNKMSKAGEILGIAYETMQERSQSYDAPEGERSMAAIVAMFNSLTGHQITEAQGWKFMVLLKLVRSEQGKDKIDNYVDACAYVALAGECVYNEIE